MRDNQYTLKLPDGRLMKYPAAEVARMERITTEPTSRGAIESMEDVRSISIHLSPSESWSPSDHKQMGDMCAAELEGALLDSGYTVEPSNADAQLDLAGTYFQITWGIGWGASAIGEINASYRIRLTATDSGKTLLVFSGDRQDDASKVCKYIAKQFIRKLTPTRKSRKDSNKD